MTIHYIKSLLLFSLLAAMNCDALEISFRSINELPELSWSSATTIHSPGSASALEGGSLIRGISDFPKNLRRIGPDTPHHFNKILEDLQLPLMVKAVDAEQWIPLLAEMWAIPDDEKRLYFKIRNQAVWSDGVALTTADIVFTLQFLTAPTTKATWQNHQITQHLRGVEVYDEHIFAFVLSSGEKASASLPLLADFRPLAQHHYQNNSSHWPEDFDWSPEPTTGAYFIDEIHPDQSLAFKKTSDWWGQDIPYFSHRFNVRQVILRQLKKTEDELDLFARAELNIISTPDTNQWSSVLATDLADHKKIQRIRFYHQASFAPNGLLINGKNPVFKNPRTRLWLKDVLDLEKTISAQTDLGAIRQSGLLNTAILSPQDYLLSETATPPEFIPVQITLSYSDIADESFLQTLQKNAQQHRIDLNLKKLPVSQITQKLSLGEYELIWLKLAQPLTETGIISLFRRDSGTLYISNPGIPPALLSNIDQQSKTAHKIEESLISGSLYTPGYSYPTTQSLYWEWLHLPDTGGTRITTDLFDPFNPQYGGLFWVNRRQRAEIMAQPDRSHNRQENLQIITTYQPQSTVSAK